MKLKKKEDQSVDASVLLKRGEENNQRSRGREGLMKERGGRGRKKKKRRIQSTRRRGRIELMQTPRKH